MTQRERTAGWLLSCLGVVLIAAGILVVPSNAFADAGTYCKGQCNGLSGSALANCLGACCNYGCPGDQTCDTNCCKYGCGSDTTCLATCTSYWGTYSSCPPPLNSNTCPSAPNKTMCLPTTCSTKTRTCKCIWDDVASTCNCPP
jgi:hypothetical protein